MAKNIYVEVKTNIPEFITPHFSTWKEWENEGKNGAYKTYSIGVEWKGQDAYFSVYDGVYSSVFKPLGDLKDRTLEILKYEDGQYKRWKIMENGEDITPNARNGASRGVKPKATPIYPKEPKTAYKAEFEQINDNIQKLVSKILKLEDDIEGLKGVVLNDDNIKAFEFHKATTRPLKEKMEKTKADKAIDEIEEAIDEAFDVMDGGVKIRTDIDDERQGDLEDLAKNNYSNR